MPPSEIIILKGEYHEGRIPYMQVIDGWTGELYGTVGQKSDDDFFRIIRAGRTDFMDVTAPTVEKAISILLEE